MASAEPRRRRPDPGRRCRSGAHRRSDPHPKRRIRRRGRPAAGPAADPHRCGTCGSPGSRGHRPGQGRFDSAIADRGSGDRYRRRGGDQARLFQRGTRRRCARRRPGRRPRGSAESLRPARAEHPPQRRAAARLTARCARLQHGRLQHRRRPAAGPAQRHAGHAEHRGRDERGPPRPPVARCAWRAGTSGTVGDPGSGARRPGPERRRNPDRNRDRPGTRTPPPRTRPDPLHRKGGSMARAVRLPFATFAAGGRTDRAGPCRHRSGRADGRWPR